MMFVKAIFPFIISAFLVGCGSMQQLPKTYAENVTSYGYIPFDPLPILTEHNKNCYEKVSGNLSETNITQQTILKLLPDQTVRIAVAQYDSKGNSSYGPATVGYEGKSYQIILDYMNTDTSRASFYVKRTVTQVKDDTQSIFPDENIKKYTVGELINLYEEVPDNITTQYEVLIDPESDIYYNSGATRDYFREKAVKEDQFQRVTIPVYVGVGLRLTANLLVLNGQVNLSGLPAIAAEAAAGNLTGSLIVQTLGVTGKSISTTLPLPSELNQTTIQNSILALGSIKALVTSDETNVTPRIVGIYNPIGGSQKFINGVISELARKEVVWRRTCIGLNSNSDSQIANNQTTNHQATTTIKAQNAEITVQPK
ncbi:MAG: hypothetical protein HQL54_13220 [Magnetococcales bacterium]|nr:hypothetical protein [Magnetococcales bacterium]